MLSCQKEGGELVPLLIAAGGGGNAYLEDPESSLDQIPLEQFENTTTAPSISGQTGAAGNIILTQFDILMHFPLFRGHRHIRTV